MNAEWNKWFSREYGVQYCQCALACIGKSQERFFGRHIENAVIIPEQKNEAMYIPAVNWANFLNSIKLLYKTMRDKKRFFREFKKLGKKYVSSAAKNARGLKAKTNAELLEGYKNYWEVYVNYTSALSVAHLLNEELAKEAEKKTAGKNIAPEIIAALLKPSEETELARLQRVAYGFKTRGFTAEQARQLAKQYTWMPCLDLMNEPWSERDINEFVARAAELKQVMLVEQAQEQAQLDKKEAKFFELMREVAYIKDLRDEYRRKGVFYARKLYGEIAKRAGLTLKQIAYATREEIIGFLQDSAPFDKNELDKRISGFALYEENKKLIILTGTAAEQFKVKLGLSAVANGSKIKGTVGCIGYAKGTAKIIRGVGDLKKISSGDVLVAITTHPDFVPAMNLASAIVTDEGGLTSHAAIVSRELRKPCIVGTKIATKVLKDGDLIEVNGDTGEVKLL